ncbi:hypothetical protein F5Y03DRAFT_385772 [Xylaria venustula]|nr:hypothetical protein F5Y03DRAFT_385772 [Xylaria venustula]
MPRKPQDKLARAKRPLPQASKQAEAPSFFAKSEARRVTRNQPKKASQKPPSSLENRRVTRSQSKKLNEAAPTNGDKAPESLPKVPKKQVREQVAVSSLEPSQELTSQPPHPLSSWLDGVKPGPVEDLSSFLGNENYSDNQPSHETRRALPDKLTADDKTMSFKSTLGISTPIQVPYKDTKTLQEAINNFLEKARAASPGEDGYAAVEDLSNEINLWKYTHSNEAVFQRTAMTSIIDRWRLDDMFDFNCEGQWSLQGKYPLPSTQGPDDKISGPKPDLAIFFNTEALLGSDGFSAPIPPSLESCIFPDNYPRRCFPFVFKETKKAFQDITTTIYANIHSASQALFNIYTWMRKAGQADAFFQHVRLFSIAINAEKMIVRTHRAKALDDRGSLIFLYHEVCVLYRYDRDTVCLLVHNILMKYGADELSKILKSTVEEVSKQFVDGTFQDDVLPKRKNGFTLGPVSKRPRTSRNRTEA